MSEIKYMDCWHFIAPLLPVNDDYAQEIYVKTFRALKEAEERRTGKVEYAVERIRELLKADKEGRVVVIPCKVGDTVWRIKRTFETYPDKSEPYIEADAFLLQDVFNIGKTVFLTREEAEKALEAREDG